LERLQRVVVFGVLRQLGESAGKVQQIDWIHLGTSVVFAVAVDIAAVEELLIKQHNDVVFGLSDDSASQAERNVLPQR
jgi:hypothetical protein